MSPKQRRPLTCVDMVQTYWKSCGKPKVQPGRELFAAEEQRPAAERVRSLALLAWQWFAALLGQCAPAEFDKDSSTWVEALLKISFQHPVY